MSKEKKVYVFKIRGSLMMGVLDFTQEQNLLKGNKVIGITDALSIVPNPANPRELGFVGTVFGASAIPTLYVKPDSAYQAIGEEVIEYNKALSQFKEKARARQSGIVMPTLSTKGLKI